ncbi:MAG: beta/gamma crystallin-related protein [Betaproteobacteria bacterium]
MFSKHKSTPGSLSLHLIHWLAALTMLFAATLASAQRYSDWTVDRNRELVVAVVTNSADSQFGYACWRDRNECLFFFMPDGLKCNEGSRYALLMNGGRESTSRSTTCRRLGWADGQQFANVLDDTEGLRKQLLNADENSIGIARGTGGDNFSIAKFSMRGFRAAYDKVNRHREDRDRNDSPREYRGDSRPTPPPPPASALNSPDVELYEHDDFKGRRLNVRGDLADLQENNFNDTVSSLIVNKGRWELCTDARYRGNCKTYAPGRYPNVRGYNDEFSSIRRVN